MAEGLTEPPSSSSKKPLDVASAVAAAVAPADPLFGKRIDFHLERKLYSLTSTPGFTDFHLETLNPSSSRPRGAPAPCASAAVPQSGKKMDGGSDPVLSFRITFRRIGAGLQNLGNTCYLNSVLQCLTYTEPLAAYCQSGEHKSSCRTAGFCAVCALQNHVMNALKSTGRILSPSHLVKNLRCISRNFRNSRQEDAHEYMVNLLESMHKCCLPSGVPTESPNAYEKSFVYRIFGGCLRSQVKCTQCHYCSNKFDPFLDLSLEIFKADSLKKALAHFTAMEQLDGGERQYQCQRCKEKVRAYKQLTVHKAPYVLTVHLKRFGPDIPGQKIDKKVDFEPTLDLKPFVSDQQETDLKYTLYGVLVHAGWSTHSGHYYCFVRTSSGMWHSLDDNQVRPVKEKTVLAQKAYMLFYVRDRSSVTKRSVDVRKDNIMANAPGNKVIPHPATLNGGIQNAERKLAILECSSAKSKVDETSQGQPVFLVRNLSGQPLIDTKNEISIKKESLPLQHNGHTSIRQTTFLQNAEGLSNRLQNSTLSKDSMILENPVGTAPPAITSSHNQKAVQDLAHPCHLKDSGVTTTSHDNDASLTHENGRVFGEKSRLYNCCNGKGESSILAAQPINSRLSNLAEKHTENFPKRKSLHNKGATNGASQNNGIPCKVDVVRAFANKEPRTFCSQLTCINGLNGKEHLNMKPAEHQITFPESDRCMNNLRCQKGRERLLKVVQSGLSTSAKMPSAANGCVQQEAVEEIEIEIEKSVSKCSTEMKRKKLGRSLLKGQYFGRKQLFTSIFLHKKKKHKRSKKHYLNPKKVIKYKVVEDLHTDDQWVSTSESNKVVDIASGCSSKKRSRSSSNKENKVVGVKDVKYSNGGFVRNRNFDSSGKNDVMLATSSEQLSSPLSCPGNQCDGWEADTHGKSPVQKGVMSLLMSLKETTVPRWDDVELPPSQARDVDDVQNNIIGYVLDEWDEEYDRGKRKKVKKSSHSFGRPNPFQEVANMKIQESMKIEVNQIRSGNQPLRI